MLSFFCKALVFLVDVLCGCAFAPQRFTTGCACLRRACLNFRGVLMSATVVHVLYCLLSEEGEGGDLNESHGGAAAEGGVFQMLSVSK